MIWLFYVICVLLTVILQTSQFIQIISLSLIKPDLILLMLIFLNLREDSPEAGESFSFFTGLAEDVLSIGLLGLNAFSKTVISFVINLVKKGLDLRKFWSPLPFVFLVSLGHESLYLMFQKIFAGNVSLLQGILSALQSSAYNAFLAPFLFFLLDRLRERVLTLKK